MSYPYESVREQQTAAQPVMFPSTVRPKVQPSRCASGVLVGFSIVAIVLAFVAFVLNVIPLAQGIRLETTNSGGRNYYPGVWFGLLELVAAVLALVFACYARGQGRTLHCGCSSGLCSAGTLLATFFGVLVVAAITATILALITFLFTVFNDVGGDNRCTDIAGSCVCGNTRITTDCHYARNILPTFYLIIAILTSLLGVVNIVISSLFCGVICCCAKAAMADETGQQHVSVAVQSAPAYSTPAYGAPAYSEYPADKPAPKSTQEEPSLPV